MASLKTRMLVDMCSKEFRGRRFNDVEDMLDTVKICLTDRQMTQCKTTSSPKGPSNKDVDEVMESNDAFWPSQAWAKDTPKAIVTRINGEPNHTLKAHENDGLHIQPKDQVKPLQQQTDPPKEIKARPGTATVKARDHVGGCGDPNHQLRNCTKAKSVWSDAKWAYEIVPTSQADEGHGAEREKQKKLVKGKTAMKCWHGQPRWRNRVDAMLQNKSTRRENIWSQLPGTSSRSLMRIHS